MKKFLVFAVVLLVLGFAASSLAMQAEIPADTTAAIAKGGTQVTVGGELRFRGATYQNTSDFNRNVANGSSLSVSSGSSGWPQGQVYESRVRLSVETRMSPNTIGFIQMEAAGGGDNFGENTNWGSEGCKGLGGTFKCGDVKSNEFRVLQAWIQHSGSGLFGVPAYVKVGHQPVVIGAGVFYSHNLNNDDAIIVGITPMKGLDLSAVTVKLQENLQNSADDQTLYSGIISYAINKDIAVGADVSFLQSQHGGTIWSYFPVKSDLGNIGFNAKANVAGFNIYGTADFQLGNLKCTPGSCFHDSWSFGGYAFTLGASYKFAPVTLGLNLGYGSGDGVPDDQKFKLFTTSQSHVAHMTFVYDYLTVNAAGNLAGGLQNTIYGQLTANVDILKGLNIGGSFTLLNAAKKAFGGGDLNTWEVTTSSKYIGTEIDINATYQIDKGLKYFVEGGYLFAGNFWKVAATGSSGGKISDPWGFRHGIQLNF